MDIQTHGPTDNTHTRPDRQTDIHKDRDRYRQTDRHTQPDR